MRKSGRRRIGRRRRKRRRRKRRGAKDASGWLALIPHKSYHMFRLSSINVDESNFPTPLGLMYGFKRRLFAAVLNKFVFTK